MEVEEFDSDDERRVLIGMVVDNHVLGRIANNWKKDYFSTKWCSLVGQWSIDYFIKYKEAPKKNIEALYESWVTTQKDEATVELVEIFLDELSDEYEGQAEDINADHVIDMAGTLFNRNKLTQLSEQIKGDLANGDTDKANSRVTNFGRVELGVGSTIDVLHDKEAMASALDRAKEPPLIIYPGALGKFFTNRLRRTGFIAILAPEKMGKSTWLIDMTFQAIKQKKNVAYFDAGDNTQDDVMERFLTRIARHPIDPGTIYIPKRIKRQPGEELPVVSPREMTYDEGLDIDKAWTTSQRLVKGHLRTNESKWKLSCHANSTLSVQGIHSILQNWDREGFVPDVIIIDYADILAPPPGVVDPRERINENWKALRALSQIYHCLVITATQADAKSYTEKTLGRANFSEDKRKYGHVTGMLGLNQTGEEKKRGLQRLNWLVARKGKFQESECVYVAGCFDIASPAICSLF